MMGQLSARFSPELISLSVSFTAEACILFYQPTKSVMQLENAHRNRAFCRLVFLFVVRLRRCEPFAGGLEILNGFICRYVARSERRWARVFFPTRLLSIQHWRNNAGPLSLFGW